MGGSEKRRIFSAGWSGPVLFGCGFGMFGGVVLALVKFSDWPNAWLLIKGRKEVSFRRLGK